MMSIRKYALGALLVAVFAACDDDPTDPGEDTLATPANVQAAAQSPTSVLVTWTAVTGAQSYVVERAEGTTGGTFAQVGTPATNSYTDNAVTAGTDYRYRVTARAGTVTSAPSADALVETPGGGPGALTIDADITANRTFHRDTVYTLKGFIKVVAPATLTIQAGTKIVGDFNTLGSSLFVLRGAKIMAVGTAAEPIVFTSSRAEGERQAGDWGGLIIVGNGIINKAGTVNIEGTGTSAENPTINYGGGTDDNDSSGELRYVRVEFAGFGPAQNQELNSFTFAAVGRGTVMSHLQALYGLDDAFEWFGGAADAKYLVSYDTGDDHFDMSEGFKGRLQYLIAYQSSAQLNIRPTAGNTSSDPVGIENDGCDGTGCTNGQSSTPYTTPLVANFTLVGTGTGSWVDGTSSGGYGMVLRRGTAGSYINGLVARWPRGAIALRDAASTGVRITSGELVLSNILVADNAAVFQAGQLTVDAGANAIIEAQGATTAGLFAALPAQPPADETGLDFTPSATSPASAGGLALFTGALATKAGTFVAGTAFRGAAPATGADARWWQGWTNYARN